MLKNLSDEQIKYAKYVKAQLKDKSLGLAVYQTWVLQSGSQVCQVSANHYIKPHPKLLIALFCEYDSTHKAQLVNLVFAN